MRRLAVALLAVLSACAGAAGDDADGVTVVATTSILGDVVSQVAGRTAEVVVLMEPGVDPHDFSPSARQVAAIESADLVVANGLRLEEGLAGTLAAAAEDGTRVLELAPLADPIPFGGSHHHEHDGHDHEGDDPHFYMDPTRVAGAVEAIATELAAIDPATDWESPAGAYIDELERLDREIEELLQPIPEERRKLVTNHDALGYFADRYGFEVVATIVPGGSTLGEPSAAELSALAALIRREGIPAIFAETTAPAALADALAREVGEEVRVYTLYTGSLGAPGSGADTYVGMMRHNARTIAEALGG
nr:zinc ABC transporter substrate-binding protein [Acidimicrobiia bacterium]